MVARIFRFSVPHIWLAQNHTEWRWIDIPIGQGPSIVPMWLTGLKKWTRYGSMINLWGPDTYQFQSTCGFSVPTYKRSVCFFFFSSQWLHTHVCEECYMKLPLCRFFTGFRRKSQLAKDHCSSLAFLFLCGDPFVRKHCCAVLCCAVLHSCGSCTAVLAFRAHFSQYAL